MTHISCQHIGIGISSGITPAPSPGSVTLLAAEDGSILTTEDGAVIIL